MSSPDWADVESAAKRLAGNHRKFNSFAWWGRPDDDERWCIVYTHNRDSGLLDQSNAELIDRELKRFFGKSVRPESHSHWAVGWVEGYAIKVYDRRGKVTAAFRKLCELQAALADYPVLDEEDYSRRELEATLENIESAGRRFIRDDAPDDWPDQVYRHLPDREIENRDDQGGYPSDDALQEALTELGLIDSEYLQDPDVPQEGDYVTEDHIYWTEYGTGKLLQVTADPSDTSSPADNWADLIRLHMKCEAFYPNVWFISDHGNAHPVSIDLEVICEGN